MKHLNIFLLLLLSLNISAQKNNEYWNNRLQIVSFRLPPPPIGYKPKLVDLNSDNKPDVIYSVTRDNIPVAWIDDDGDMKWTDFEGDTKNDCLLIDRNRDGIYGGQGDLIIDWVDTDNDGHADMQIVVEYPAERTDEVWPNGHYMIVMDLDHDNIFNYINWNTMKIHSWDKAGLSDFYTDYSGQTAFMKIHASTYNMKDLRINWENPFLFYDKDNDGLSEMAIRVLDSTKKTDANAPDNSYVNRQVSGQVDWISMAFDMDNDNVPGNEFDFDMTIGFQGEGFNYMDQLHPVKNLRGLPEADSLFMDPRWRQITELIYPDHDNAWDLIFNRGKWKRVNFVWDEDDDCSRWERVEFYDPFDPFKVGWNGGGVDNHKQSDAMGDRGEWDMDNSGNGKLYISKFDGRIHLYGAEWGCWRIDQNTDFFQGWDRLWFGLDKNPNRFATVKYTDTNNNGFLDRIEYDMDGDKQFETQIDLTELGIDERCDVIDISSFKYEDFTALMQTVADNMWTNAKKACMVAEINGINTTWYAKLKQASSIREKYHKGYWLQYYLYKDLEYQFMRNNEKESLTKLNKAYYSGNWDMKEGDLRINMGNTPIYNFGTDPTNRQQTNSKSVFASKPFVHPGMAQSQDDLDFMREKVLKGEEPWKTAFDSLKKKTSLDFVPQAVSFISVGPYGQNSIGGREFSRSTNEVYNHALMWYITKNKAYAEKAIEILNAWSVKLRSFDANNAKLNVGLSGYFILNAAEILKYSYPEWKENDIEQFKRMILTVFYPTIKDFFAEANGNWDASMISTMLCIGVFVDDHEIFNRAVNRYYWGERNSGITKYIYPGGQCQEATRDWGHVQLGIGEFAKAAQTALTQGLDFYSVAQDRLAYGFEQTSKMMLDNNIDIYGVLSKRDLVLYKDIYESIYDYYKNVRGIELPYTREVILNHTRRDFPIGVLTGIKKFPPLSNGPLKTLPILDFLNPTKTGAIDIPTKEIPDNHIIINPGESIQDAIDKNKGNGKAIILAKGVHTLEAPLKIYSSTNISGYGKESILFLSPKVRTETIVNGEDNISNVTIRDILIEGASSTIENEDPNHDRRSRLYMSAPSREGIIIRSEKGGEINNLLFENVTIQNFTKNGVLIIGASNIKINRCDFSDNGASVVPGAGLQHNLNLSYVTDCEITNSRFDTSPCGNGVYITFGKNIMLSDNEMCRNKLSGIYCAESENINITDNLTEGNDEDGISIDAMMLGCKQVILQNNHSQNNGRHGIMTKNTTELKESGNIISFNAK